MCTAHVSYFMHFIFKETYSMNGYDSLCISNITLTNLCRFIFIPMNYFIFLFRMTTALLVLKKKNGSCNISIFYSSKKRKGKLIFIFRDLIMYSVSCEQ